MDLLRPSGDSVRPASSILSSSRSALGSPDCSTVFQGVPPRSKAFQNTQNAKTNPVPGTRSPQQLAALSRAVAGVVKTRSAEVVIRAKSSEEPSPACSTMFQGVPPRSKAFQNTQNAKTNPSPIGQPPADLTPRQLAAARLLLEGLSAEQTAIRLGTTRQTVNRWKHVPAFAHELRRLNEVMGLQADQVVHYARRQGLIACSDRWDDRRCAARCSTPPAEGS
jgi:hypothetical protein